MRRYQLFFSSVDQIQIGGERDLLVRCLAVIFCFALATPCLAHNPTTPPVVVRPAEPNESIATPASYAWNLNNSQRPLLNLADQAPPDIALALTYPSARFALPLLQALKYNERSDEYNLKLLSSSGGRVRFVELQPTDTIGNYGSTDGSNLHLIQHKGLTLIRSDATEYTFVRLSDNTIRCIRVTSVSGPTISLVYTRENLIHGLIDSSGRMIQFNYEAGRLTSIKQTWTVNSVAVSRLWFLDAGRGEESQVQYVHASTAQPVATRLAKSVPRNAITREYTDVMARIDRQLAGVFGGPGAVAAANGFEPVALSERYPLYRGDFVADDGRVLRGHLSYAMHLYGNADGTADSGLYVPAGFTSHSDTPTPTDAVITFYYPRLGNLTNVTLAVFHVANFHIRYEGARVRIGNIGGLGGDTINYRHSHLEFYRGDTGLPPSATRANLRIDPAGVFPLGFAVATRSTDRNARGSF